MSKTNEKNKITVTSVEEYLKQVSEIKKEWKNAKLAFRGQQKVDWPLDSAAERRLIDSAAERRLIDSAAEPAKSKRL